VLGSFRQLHLRKYHPSSDGSLDQLRARLQVRMNVCALKIVTRS
jgi:hypothetical protein